MLACTAEQVTCRRTKRSWIVPALFVAGLAACAVAQDRGTGYSPRAVLTRTELAAAVESNWSRIEDVSLAYRYTVVGEHSPGVVGFDLVKLVIQGPKTYLYTEYDQPETEQTERRTIRREVAFNGEVTTVHEPQRAKAMILPSREAETFTDVVFYTNVMKYGCLENRPGSTRPDLDNLAVFLKLVPAKVRDHLEQVDGRWCYALDLVLPQGWTARTLWIDPERGYLPVREVLYSEPDGDGEQIVLNESHIEEAVEVAPGLWFPVRARTMMREVDPAGVRCEYEMQVNQTDEGKWDLAVNAGVDDEFFDLWKRLPSGTEVLDARAQVTFTVGGGEFTGMADQLETVPEFSSLPVPERAGAEVKPEDVAQQQIPSRSVAPSDSRNGWNRGWLIYVAAAVALIGATAVLVVRRKRRWKETAK